MCGFGAGAMALAYQATAAWSQARMVAEFERRARMVLGPLQAELDASLELTESMADVFGAGLPISQRLFDTVAKGARDRHRQLLALEWTARVPRGSEAAFEEHLRGEVGAFRIVDVPGATADLPPTDRFPVTYVSPLEPNRAALGLDLASETERRRALERAVESARPVVSPILRLVQGAEGFVVLVPSYHADQPHETPAQRRAALRGLGVAVYSLQRLVEIALRAGRPLQVRTEVIRGTTADAAGMDTERSSMNSAWTVRSHGARGRVAMAVDLIPDQAVGHMAGWYLRISPAPGASWAAFAGWPWLGVLGVGTLVWLACSLILRTARARELAGELTVANATLAAEVQERAQAERTVRRQAELVTLSLDTMNLVAWHLDVRAEELTRSSAAGLVTRPMSRDAQTGWTSLLPELRDEDRERIGAYVQGIAAARDTSCRFEFATVGAADGNRSRFEVIGRLRWDENGKLVSFTGLEADVTERRRVEEEQRRLHEHLQNTQRLEGLGILAGGVAHDFNNLIMGIMGGLALLQERCRGDAEVNRALGLIDRGATRAAELTRQLLAYAGREQVAVEATAVDELVRDLVPLLETSAGKRVTLALEVEAAIPAVQADATQLRQIVMNLVINAAEAMTASGGTVAIRAGCRTYERAMLAGGWPANDLPAGRYVLVEVTDTGCGMSRETQQRIFDPFFTTKFTGRGLGLAAVLGIVRAHRGAILVESALGRGTTVTVLLPPAPTATAPAVPPAPPDVWRGSGTILVVDDEPIARDVTADMLQRIGFATVTAGDGRQALDRLEPGTAAFAGVVLDLTMPGPSGLDVHRELRRRAPALPVLLMSGYSAHDAREALAGGAPTAFLQKPFRLADLVRALRDLFEPRSTP
jgi:signal transduction histidine kinase/CheY-like chemotaxis protein